MAELGSATKTFHRFDLLVPEFSDFVHSWSSASRESDHKRLEVDLSAEEWSTIADLAAVYDATPEVVVMALLDWLGEMSEADLVFPTDGSGQEDVPPLQDDDLQELLPQAISALERANAVAAQTIQETANSRERISQAAREIDRQLGQLDRSLAQLVDG